MQTRRSLRMPGFDYRSTGVYFVTVCARRRGDIFGGVVGDHVDLNALGAVVAGQVAGLPRRLVGLTLDVWQVMPDHVHAILGLGGGHSLGEVVAAFKAGASREAGMRLWQRGYFDHVVRDDADLDRVREYVATNPLRWTLARASQGSPLRNPSEMRGAQGALSDIRFVVGGAAPTWIRRGEACLARARPTRAASAPRAPAGSTAPDA